jgi:hypothetical protein
MVFPVILLVPLMKYLTREDFQNHHNRLPVFGLSTFESGHRPRSPYSRLDRIPGLASHHG